MINSRLITHPDVITEDKNNGVVLVDPTEEEVTKVHRFLETSGEAFDVYVYRNEDSDLEYLNAICEDSKVLIKHTSKVTVTGSQTYQDDLLDRFEQLEANFGWLDATKLV